MGENEGVFVAGFVLSSLLQAGRMGAVRVGFLLLASQPDGSAIFFAFFDN